MKPYFDIVGDITDVETIAVGNKIREVKRLVRAYGPGRWRKCKGITRVRLQDGTVFRAEIHWYEMTNVGKKEIKIKHLL